MNIERKQRLLDQLVAVGLREIELGFPAASQIDVDFVRRLIQRDAIAPQVMPMVITQACTDLIEHTVESLHGAKRAAIHLDQALRVVAREVDERDGVTVNIVVACGDRQWRTRGHGGTRFGAARNDDSTTAMAAAVLSAAMRLGAISIPEDADLAQCASLT